MTALAPIWADKSAIAGQSRWLMKWCIAAWLSQCRSITTSLSIERFIK